MERIPQKWQHVGASWPGARFRAHQTLSLTLPSEKHKRTMSSESSSMSSWFDLPTSTWGCEESWPKTPSTVVDTTSPCSSITTLILDPKLTVYQPLPRKLPPIFEFIPGTIVSKPNELLQFKHTKGLYKFFFCFQNKLLIKADHKHAIQHWYFYHYDTCPYHNNPCCC